MTKMYIIRHCEAMGNAKRLFQGSTDCDISEMGQTQLEYLKKRFENINLDTVFSSPLTRAVKTARAVAEPKGLLVNTRDEFAELHGGVVEGRPFAEAFNEIEGLADTWNNHPQDFAPEGGESMRHAYQRIYDAVMDLARENKGKTIAVATHGGVLRCLMCRLIYNDINRLAEVSWCENTAVSLVEFDDNFKPRLVFMNDHSHVPSEYLPKRSRIVAKI